MARGTLTEEEGVVVGLTHDGEGVIRGERTAFVAGALPGERVRFRRRASRRQHDEGELIEVLEASPDRVTPRCAHFGVCGGCALQHLDPARQLALRQQELVETLERVGKVTPREWLAPLAGPVWNYRRRARLGAKDVKGKSRVLVGFRERAKPYVADLRRCEILAPPVDGLLEPLARLIESLSIRRELPQIEVAVGDDATALVLRVLAPPSEADLERLRAFEREHTAQTLRLFLQPGGPETVQPLSGDASLLRYALPESGVELEFSPTDFVQINGAINRRLAVEAVRLLAPEPGDRVLDLFCGLGNFSLPLARHSRAVLGVEGDAGLVARAQANAARNGLDNARFAVGNLFQPDPATMPWLSEPADRVLLDPPRVGARELVPYLGRLAPRRLVYISCHVATLARDLGELVNDQGFELLAAGVVDMFPHTAHVETVAVLEPGRRLARQAARAGGTG